MRKFLLLMLSLLMTQTILAAELRDHFFFNREGLRLHYLESGSGSQTIVFIPGWLMPAAVFRLQLEALGNKFRVIAFDPRSQGKSQIASGSHAPVQRMNDMEDLLAAANVGDYVLAGWSLGVMESLDFIERKPQSRLRGLILIDNSIGEGAPPAARPGKRNSALNDPSRRERYLADFCRGIFHSQAPDDIARAVLDSALRVPNTAAVQLINQPYPRTYWRDVVRKQEVPILYAIRPGLREQGDALQANKGAMAQVELFEEAGHTLFVDEPERFNALVSEFARRAFIWQPVGGRSVSNAIRISSDN